MASTKEAPKSGSAGGSGAVGGKRASSAGVVGLSSEQLFLYRRAFSMFDYQNNGEIETDKIHTILITLGNPYDEAELDRYIRQEDTEGTGRLKFDAFCRVVVRFTAPEEDDDEVMLLELKEAFRLYDKDGNGYIPVDSLREILLALDDQLTGEQLNELIEEIDTDSSGTVDFDEFMEMMTGD